MSKRSFLSLGGVLCVGVVTVVGCSSGESDSASLKGAYSTSALDVYMADAPTVESRFVSNDSSPSGRDVRKTVPTKSYGSDGDYSQVSFSEFCGDWTAKLDMDDASASDSGDADPAMAGLGMAIADAMAETFSMTLSLEKDHSFEMVMVFVPIEGTWEKKGNSLFLTPESIMGFSQEDAKKIAGSRKDENGVTINMEMKSEDFEVLELRITEDGNALVEVDSSNEGEQELVFRR